MELRKAIVSCRKEELLISLLDGLTPWLRSCRFAQGNA